MTTTTRLAADILKVQKTHPLKISKGVEKMVVLILAVSKNILYKAGKQKISSIAVQQTSSCCAVKQHLARIRLLHSIEYVRFSGLHRLKRFVQKQSAQRYALDCWV